MPIKIKLSKDTMCDILDDDVIEDTICDTSRWSVLHNIIFPYKGKFYETQYSVGATEQQEESPWEYEEEVECVEVEQVETVVKAWKPVKEGS